MENKNITIGSPIGEVFANEFNKHIDELEEHQEQYWNSLTKDQQLMAFCAVVRRIFKGEVEQEGSYRYLLYDVFEFGPESYVAAQVAGYLTIHNLIGQGIDYDRMDHVDEQT